MNILSLATSIDHHDAIHFIILVDQQWVGYCELALTNEQVHVATLYSVYVDPAHRHQGYASRLVSAALEAAPAHEMTAVNLRVHEANSAALSLYNNLGFEQYEGPDGEGFVDMWLTVM